MYLGATRIDRQSRCRWWVRRSPGRIAKTWRGPLQRSKLGTEAGPEAPRCCPYKNWRRDAEKGEEGGPREWVKKEKKKINSCQRRVSRDKFARWVCGNDEAMACGWDGVKGGELWLLG